MKTIKKQSRNIILSLAAVTMMLVFSACATKAPFLSSAVVPAAEGTVFIKTDGNKNYVIKIQTKNLADSQKLTPPKNVYVVWLVTDNNSTKNIGQIISTSGSMSSKLKSTFETISSFSPKKIFITAENEASISYPYSEVVLTTDFISLKN